MPRNAVRIVLCICAGAFSALLIHFIIHGDAGSPITPFSFLVMIGFLGACASRQANDCRMNSELGNDPTNELRPWQFSLRRLLLSVTAMAVALAFGTQILTKAGRRSSDRDCSKRSYPFSRKSTSWQYRHILWRLSRCIFQGILPDRTPGPAPTADNLTALLGICLLTPSAVLLQTFLERWNKTPVGLADLV